MADGGRRKANGRKQMVKGRRLKAEGGRREAEGGRRKAFVPECMCVCLFVVFIFLNQLQ